jgi:hypothetical protein
MAGAFGFEAGEHYDVSMRVGERVLLPAVREAPADTLIIANGFSCREQIAQTTDRRALHLAQVIQMAKREAQAPPRQFPERRYVEEPQSENRRAAALLAGALAGGAIGWALARRK